MASNNISEDAWEQIFFIEDFNVDECLASYTLKSDLHTLRNNLREYGVRLHKRMSDILRTETEAIVNLAEYLTNLQSTINDLSIPISQLREEIKTLYELISKSETSCRQELTSTRLKIDQCHSLELKGNLMATCSYISDIIKRNDQHMFYDPILLERLVSKFSNAFNQFRLLLVDVDISEAVFIGEYLTGIVNEIFCEAIREKDVDGISRCLRMYDNLGKEAKAEKIYRVQIVRPHLHGILNMNHLAEVDHNVENIYKEVLNFLDKDVAFLIRVVKETTKFESFDFILKSCWWEIDAQLRENLPLLTAPGNPDLFQKRYVQTSSFLKEIAKRYKDVNYGKDDRLTNDESFTSHMSRFNLSVYYEIRVQQVAVQFETEAVNLTNRKDVFAEEPNALNCKLRITATFFDCLKRFFDSDVFIETLTPQIIKISMVLLSRYLTLLTPPDSDYNDDDFLICIINDINVIKSLIGWSDAEENAYEKISQSIFGKLPFKTYDHLVEIVQSNNFELNQKVRFMNIRIMLNHVQESHGILKQVSAIPRLYRRTNRVAPIEASAYMVDAVRPIMKFSNRVTYNNFNKTYSQLMEKELRRLLNKIIKKLAELFSEMVEEVLNSVYKTEKTLRKLKNRSAQSEDDDPNLSITMSDEQKIREQIRLDVNYFVELLEPFCFEDGKEKIYNLRRKVDFIQDCDSQ